MGIRYEGKVVSTNSNTVYTCQLIDINFSGTKTLIELGGNGFDLTYLQQGDERYAPIKGSELDLHCIITDNATGIALLSWINSQVNATKEDQFYIRILKNGGLFWYGVILPDLNMAMDESKPFSYHIKATDGLARLKDLRFNYSGGRRTFIEMIWQILKETPLYQNGANLLFTTCVEWYEATMPARSVTLDPLRNSQISPYTYAIKEENQKDIGMTYWDVLTNICEQWGMRIMLSDGLFRLYQVNVYENDGLDKYERAYLTSNGVIDSSGTFGYNMTLSNDAAPYTLAGNQWSFYPALKKVNLKYPFVNSNMLDTLDTMVLLPPYRYSSDLRDGILGGTNKKLKFACTLNVNIIDIFRVGKEMNVTVSIKIKLGSKYLKKDSLGSIVTWTTNSADRYEINIPKVFFGITPIVISFTTPDIPAGVYNTNEFYIEVSEIVESLVPNVLNPNSDYVVSRALGSSSLLYNASVTNNKEAYNLYTAQNTIAAINSYTLDCNDAMFGEPFDNSNPGAMYIYDGSAFYASTQTWRLYDTGHSTNFNQLRVNENLSGQKIATRKYQGGILGAILLPHSSFTYDSYIYILNGGTFTANDETWQGEWYAIGINRSDTIEVDNGGGQGASGGDTQLRGEIGGVQSQVSNLGNVYDKVYFSPYTASTTLEPITQLAAASGTKTFTLPHAYDANPTGNLSIVITIVNSASTGETSTLTVNTQDGAKIGATGVETTTVTESNSKTFITDGTNWFLT
jgi:hypothetical protein